MCVFVFTATRRSTPLYTKKIYYFNYYVMTSTPNACNDMDEEYSVLAPWYYPRTKKVLRGTT